MNQAKQQLLDSYRDTMRTFQVLLGLHLVLFKLLLLWCQLVLIHLG